LDPQYVLAYAGIPDSYILIGGFGYGFLSRDLVIEKANDAVKRRRYFYIL
jgi:hypothetical protein